MPQLYQVGPDLSLTAGDVNLEKDVDADAAPVLTDRLVSAVVPQTRGAG